MRDKDSGGIVGWNVMRDKDSGGMPHVGWECVAIGSVCPNGGLAKGKDDKP